MFKGRELQEISGATLQLDLTMELQKRITEPPRSDTMGSKESVLSRKTIDTKKVRGPESPLWTAICPVVYFIRVFGLAPYEFHNDTLVPSRIYCIFAYVCLIVYAYLMYTVMARFTRNEEQPLLGQTETIKVSFRRRDCEILIVLSE